MKTACLIVFWPLLVPAGPSLASGSAPSMLAAATSVNRDLAQNPPSDEPRRARSELEEPNATPSEAEERQAVETPLVLWSPRTDRGAPALREGGATRGATRELTLLTLVPKINEAALTIAAQPVLHWYLSIDISDLVYFTLVDPDEVHPIVEVMLKGPHTAGSHSVDLAQHGVELQSGHR